jgi:dihydrofolate synthase/folylpolyglutamate synthase
MSALPSPQPGWTLADWLGWQERLHPRSIELGLERVRGVAERLGLCAPRASTLTVAGTNGKGSSATLAAAIYREAGYRVGLYTSPHLQRYNERIAVDGVAVDDAALCRAFEAIEAARAGVTLTYFEFGTLAALWLFREAGVELQILEVGLGGRLDAVNLIDADGALITNIGIDHTDWLGPERESIGREKAGVLRRGRPAVVAERHPPHSIGSEAERLETPIVQLGRDYDFSPRDHHWLWHGLDRRLEQLPLPGLAGAMQLQNASGVIALLTQLQAQLPVAEDAIRRALQGLQLPGRLQRVGRFLLDVAHNAEAAQALAEHVRATMAPAARVWLVLGMLADKPVEACGRVLAPLVHHVFLAGLPGPRGLDGAALDSRLRSLGLDTEVCRDVPEALARAEAAAGADDLIVVTGSFLTVGAALEYLHE